MLHVYIRRFCFGDDSTLSMFLIGREFVCFTLEDQVREGEKVPGETAIPYGTFAAELRTEGGFHDRYTNRFFEDPVIDHIGMIHLTGVPGFSYIQLHPGNTDEHTEGCPLVGLNPVKRSDGHNNYDIQRATDAYRLVYPPISKHLDEGKPVLFHVERMRG